MLHQLLVENLAKNLKIAPLNIIREYLEIEVLDALSRSDISKELIFYGGTALRLAYGSFRYSEDLDFLLKNHKPGHKEELKSALAAVAENNRGVEAEDIHDKRWTLFGLLRIRHELLKHPIRIKVEMSKKKNGISSENALLTSPATNKEPLFRTADLESVYKLKTAAMRNRQLARDWFDYWYLCQKTKREKETGLTFPFDKKEFGREMKRWLPQDKWGVIKTVISFYES